MDPALRYEYVTRRDPIERLVARLAIDGASEDELAELRAAAAAEVAAGLAEAESAPAADPARLEQGVYATPIEP
jgi:TPP-dependent pyruvate/acetoin dehydrogenase alpha subunit